MVEICILHSLRHVDADGWNACFPRALEDYYFLRGTEDACLPGFAWRYVVATEGETILAALPAFLTDYSLDTTLEGTAKKLTTGMRRLFPQALTLKMACIGSPVTEYGRVGFHPSTDAAQQSALLEAMMAAFEAEARAMGYGLVALKDVPSFQRAVWQHTLERRGYRGIPGLPVADLAIDFATMDEYFARLSAATRKDMRRKLKVREKLRIEYRTEIDDVLPQVMALYRSTRARAEMQLEELNEPFFRGMLQHPHGNALCVLYFAGDELLAANLLLKHDGMLLDKFFCMDGRGREYNLYFVSWFTNIEYCLAHGIAQYQSGQAAYDTKLRLGSTLTRTTMYFKHRNRLIQGALRIAAPFLAADDLEAA